MSTDSPHCLESPPVPYLGEKMWHRHKWEIVGTHYHPPSSREFSVDRGGYEVIELMNRMLGGWTDISLKCTECGDIGVKQVVGKYAEG